MTPHVTRQTEPFVAACARAAETVVMLGNSHFHVLDVCIDLPRPTIRVRECEAVRRMIERGDAAYYARSGNTAGAQRKAAQALAALRRLEGAA